MFQSSGTDRSGSTWAKTAGASCSSRKEANLWLAGSSPPNMMQLFKRLGRDFDIEIKGHHLYLIANRSTAAGSQRRWKKQRALIDELAATLASSSMWEYLRKNSRRLNVRNTEIRADIKRAVTIFFSVLAAITVVIILIVLTASGHIEWFDF